MSSSNWYASEPIIYASATLSLAAFELFVHLGRTDSKIALVKVRTEIPEDVPMESVDPTSLPNDWRASPPIPATVELGTQWCLDRRSVILKVPSTLVPGEYNYLLNPTHADFRRIKISTPKPFSFDSRMWK
jgi:RES domain-containing protein